MSKDDFPITIRKEDIPVMIEAGVKAHEYDPEMIDIEETIGDCLTAMLNAVRHGSRTFPA